MARVSPLDAAWLQVETYESPMHVGCLQIFAPPPHRGRDYVGKLTRDLRAPHPLAPPFCLKLKPSPLQAVLPEWIEEPRPDMSYHVRRSALPPDTGEAGLHDLVASLYGVGMDRSRPLWECHVIEGLDHGRVALFTKIHHSLMDGIGGIRLLQSMLSPSASEHSLLAPWARHAHRHEAPAAARHSGLWERAGDGLALARDVYSACATHWHAWREGAGPGVVMPYSAPRSRLNGPIGRHRAFATQRIPLERVRALAQAAGVTINDVFLALCAGALRHDLLAADELPGYPLVAGVPVSVRADGDASVGTAISFLLAGLATDVANPLTRLMEIHRSTTAGKERLKKIGRGALAPYTLLMMAPHMLQLMTGLHDLTPPVFNLAISNVPGPAQPLYFNGARLEAMYPMSVLTHGQGVNITTVSYDGVMHVGLTACHHAVHRLAYLAENLGAELALLESLFRRPGSVAAHRAAA